MTGLLLIIAGCSNVPSDVAIPWAPSFPLGFESAAQTGKDVFVFFEASWCSVCKRMKSGALADPGVQRALRDYVAISVDIDDEPYLAEKYRIEALPTVIVLSSAGVERHRTIGNLEADALMRLLTVGETTATGRDSP